MEYRYDISVVVPVFRSAAILPSLIDRLKAALDATGKEYEIILVEDGGGDDTWATILQLAPDCNNLKAFRLARNFGQHNALMCGFSEVQGRYVVTLDDDLQTPPEEIHKLLECIETNSETDIVYGVPEEKKHSFLRNAGSSLAQALFRRIFRVNVYISSFRVIRSDIVRAICSYNKNFTFIDGLIAWHTTSIDTVITQHTEREHGQSGYSFGKLLALSLNMLTNFSIQPLQVATLTGILFSGIGFLLALAYLIKYLVYGIPVPGYTSIILGITMFSGVQLLSLGMIGEYLGRVHMNINSKPQYHVREKLPD